MPDEITISKEQFDEMKEKALKWVKFEAWLDNQAEDRDAGGGDSVECGVSISELKRMF